MPREFYLIVGLGKTGTTAVAMTLANTLKVTNVLLEPKDLTAIEKFIKSERVVVKIIFDHWQNRADALTAVVNPAPDVHPPTTIVIVRDPRDEAISRLHYTAYHYFSTRPTTLDERTAWIDIFRRKEETLNSVGMMDMQNEIMSRFGIGFLPGPDLYDAYCRFIDDIGVPNGPRVHLLRYEDFVRGTIQDELLQSILSGNRDVGPALRRVFRTGRYGDWQHFLTDQDLFAFNSTCEPFLRRFEYPFERGGALGRPSSATGSDYVARLIDEACGLFEKISLRS
jgi:hypothetical protein